MKSAVWQLSFSDEKLSAFLCILEKFIAYLCSILLLQAKKLIQNNEKEESGPYCGGC